MDLGRGTRRRGWERAAGALRGDWHLRRPDPRHVQSSLAAAPRLPAQRWGSSPRHPGACVSPVRAPVRPYIAAGSARLSHRDSRCARARGRGPFHPGDPLPPIYTLTWACVCDFSLVTLIGDIIEANNDYLKATLCTSPAPPGNHRDGLRPPSPQT